MTLKTSLTIILVIISALMGFTLAWYIDGTKAKDDTKDAISISFNVKNGDMLSNVSGKLFDSKLIKNKTVFYLEAKKMGIDKKLQVGVYKLNSAMTPIEIAKRLTTGETDEISITIKEGLRNEEIGELLSKKLPFTTKEFTSASKNLNGYLFPDTYFVGKDSDAKTIISLMKNTMEKKFTQEMEKIAKQTNGLTRSEILTLASLVQREGVVRRDGSNDFDIIANILLKRLRTTGWTLDVDASLQYEVASRAKQEEGDWWTSNVTDADKQSNSPYNLYKVAGLPPTPIANPGLTAISAVVNATGNTPYWFYIHKDREIYPAKTLEEQSANIKKYLKSE